MIINGILKFRYIKQERRLNFHKMLLWVVTLASAAYAEIVVLGAKAFMSGARQACESQGMSFLHVHKTNIAQVDDAMR